MMNVVSEEHQSQARGLKELFSVFRQNQDLISIGAYERGSDPKIDLAILAHEPIREYMRQARQDRVTMTQSTQGLEHLAGALRGAAER